MLRQYKLKDYNFRLVIWVLSLSIMGVLLVGSADASLQFKQMLGVIFGFVLMVVISLIDYSWILSFHWIIYGSDLALLLFVLIRGWATHGARRWVNLGFVQFQPVE
ncbi:MAG: FtsW/RodA/SpoVE family cell cycle protein, partial [Lachnospiraceae bacterium]|nr:FtsW/RodA/SpoVE family cell cycle protein [Candidatus Equihabitans merdae]